MRGGAGDRSLARARPPPRPESDRAGVPGGLFEPGQPGRHHQRLRVPGHHPTAQSGQLHAAPARRPHGRADQQPAQPGLRPRPLRPSHPASQPGRRVLEPLCGCRQSSQPGRPRAPLRQRRPGGPHGSGRRQRASGQSGRRRW